MKLRYLLLTAGLCLGLCACGGGEDAVSSVTNTESGVTVSLGMTREEVGESLTPRVDATWVEDSWGEGSMFYGETPEESLVVLYVDNQVRSIIVDDRVNSAETSQWQLKDGVTKGSSLEDIVAAYGENEHANTENNLFSYDQEDGSKVSFLVDEDGLRVFGLSIGVGADDQNQEPEAEGADETPAE